jgi:NAD(P)-dependent dehydrogenase (short-subunit alcohol dehydrogenase family)
MIDTASKGAVLAMSRELAIVHAKDGIRVNALCPGPLNTPLLQNFLDTPEKRHRRTVHLPTGRFGIHKLYSVLIVGEAIEQAHAAVFLASDESSYITATVYSPVISILTCRISW